MKTPFVKVLIKIRPTGPKLEAGGPLREVFDGPIWKRADQDPPHGSGKVVDKCWKSSGTVLEKSWSMGALKRWKKSSNLYRTKKVETKFKSVPH